MLGRVNNDALSAESLALRAKYFQRPLQLGFIFGKQDDRNELVHLLDLTAFIEVSSPNTKLPNLMSSWPKSK
jgi:hypothetical protein